ncbi:MAG: hypothetical protein QOD60_815 [Solirubrobacterales bacterium]|jgi:hypothetical protein|nr:hypothetical protein [Solirubrobacterales bacterium]
MACLAVGMLVGPAATSAQSSGTTQYTPDIATAGVTATGASGGKKSPNSGTAGANAAGGVAGEAQSGGGGTLPFTGYPLTLLVALVAILLAAGLVLRVTVPRLDRRHI